MADQHLVCPVAACRKPVSVSGNVFCETGEYDDARDRYETEGDASVYSCSEGHRFAYDPPQPEED